MQSIACSRVWTTDIASPYPLPEQQRFGHSSAEVCYDVQTSVIYGMCLWSAAAAPAIGAVARQIGWCGWVCIMLASSYSLQHMHLYSAALAHNAVLHYSHNTLKGNNM